MADAYNLLDEDDSPGPEAIRLGWEDHGGFSVLMRPPIVAVVFHNPPHGMIRQSAREASDLGTGTAAELKARVESILRDGATVWERLLEDDDVLPEPTPQAEDEPTMPRERRARARRTGKSLGVTPIKLGEDEP